MNADNRAAIGKTPGTVAALVQLLATGTEAAKQNAAGALANDNADNRAAIFSTPVAIAALVQLLKVGTDGKRVGGGGSQGPAPFRLAVCPYLAPSIVFSIWKPMLLDLHSSNRNCWSAVENACKN
jgi:hypothetical protein